MALAAGSKPAGGVHGNWMRLQCSASEEPPRARCWPHCTQMADPFEDFEEILAQGRQVNLASSVRPKTATSKPSARFKLQAASRQNIGSKLAWPPNGAGEEASNQGAGTAGDSSSSSANGAGQSGLAGAFEEMEAARSGRPGGAGLQEQRELETLSEVSEELSVNWRDQSIGQLSGQDVGRVDANGDADGGGGGVGGANANGGPMGSPAESCWSPVGVNLVSELECSSAADSPLAGRTPNASSLADRPASPQSGTPGQGGGQVSLAAAAATATEAEREAGGRATLAALDQIGDNVIRKLDKSFADMMNSISLQLSGLQEQQVGRAEVFGAQRPEAAAASGGGGGGAESTQAMDADELERIVYGAILKALPPEPAGQPAQAKEPPASGGAELEVGRLLDYYERRLCQFNRSILINSMDPPGRWLAGGAGCGRRLARHDGGAGFTEREPAAAEGLGRGGSGQGGGAGESAAVLTPASACERAVRFKVRGRSLERALRLAAARLERSRERAARLAPAAWPNIDWLLRPPSAGRGWQCRRRRFSDNRPPDGAQREASH